MRLFRRRCFEGEIWRRQGCELLRWTMEGPLHRGPGVIWAGLFVNSMQCVRLATDERGGHGCRGTIPADIAVPCEGVGWFGLKSSASW